MLDGPGIPINKKTLGLSLRKGKWQPWRCYELTSFPEVLLLAHTFRKLQVVQDDQYKSIFWRLARDGNTEVGRNQFVMGPG